MRPILLNLSAGLNVLLLAVLWVQHPCPQPAETLQEHPPVPDPHAIAATEDPRNTAAVPTPPSGPLDWRAVESDDYPTYVANLRAIGVPEPTIRDIIVADVGQLYDQQRAALAGQAGHLASGRGFASAVAALDREEREVLELLLGPHWEMARDNASLQSGSETAAALTPESLASARGIDDTFREEAEQIREQAGLFLQPGDRERLAELRQTRRAELVKTLGEPGFLEYEFQFSDLGRSLEQGSHFSWEDDAEVRGVFEILHRFEEQQALAPLRTAEESAEELARAEEERNQALKERLGDDRYEAYQRSLDFRYQQLQDLLGGRYGLEPDVAVAVYDARQQTLAASAADVSNPNEAAEDPTLGLDLAFRDRLGEEAWAAVKQLERSWVE